MNLIKLALLSLFFLNSLCFLRKHKEKAQLQLKSKQSEYLQNYIAELANSLYNYKQIQGVQLVELEALDYIAQREAQSIIDNNDFGQHVRFPDWVDSVPNDYFTEVTLNVQIHQLPDAVEFAQKVLEAIEEEQPFYLSHEEDFFGVHIQEWEFNPNQYTIIIMLLKKPQYLSSCKEQLFFNEFSTTLTIKVKGELYDVECDTQTDHGGWTLIGKMEKTLHDIGTVYINDLGLDYTELLWVADSNYYMDLNSQWSHDWDFSGWNLEINMINFDGVWYLSKQTPEHRTVPQGAIRGSGFSNIESMVGYFDKDNDIEILEEARECNIRAITVDGFCAEKFIMKNLPGKIQAVSDVESISQVDNTDNIYDMYFRIYVR